MKFLKWILKFFTAIIASILCVVIFILEFGVHIVIDTKGYLSEENITKIIEKIDLNDLLVDEKGNKTEIAADIYEMIEDAEIEEEALDKILESKSLRELVEKYIGSSVEAVLYDKEVIKPTVDEIVFVVEDNFDIIEEIAKEQGEVLTESDKQELLKEIRKTAPELIESLPDITVDLEQDSEEIITVIRTIYDTKYLIMAIGTIILLVLIIALIRFSISGALMWLAVPTIISSMLFVVISFLSGLANKLLLQLELDKQISDFITNNILSSLFNKFLISGLIGLLIGGLLIFGYKVLRKRKQIHSAIVE